ncbi:hypothetical protein VTJ83DRAFT_2611 [Remersonia thermophila]|uniref:Xylanolytic transcriptional activator regulatory domain-containing protein n=1 Tax=Remersonia thermophila TaxID=72144 RepID=A0ABR4DJF6_9PEZI
MGFGMISRRRRPLGIPLVHHRFCVFYFRCLRNGSNDSGGISTGSTGSTGWEWPGIRAAGMRDRQKPICARCSRAGVECVYPESRRKPAFKRRNVRELEERLAQVEGLLRIVGKQRDGLSVLSAGAGAGAGTGTGPWSPGRQPGVSARRHGSPLEGSMSWIPTSPADSLSPGDSIPSAELLRLGRFESLPPPEMVDDLHAIFFSREQNFLPIVHPGNYLRSFHAPPHMRPPMALQYAIWAAASNGHPKYGAYHDALYSRARQYLEADEQKGQGEHFITLAHAQAWVLVATDEARCLMFTRAAMSSARAVRLSSMMGLSRLDSSLGDDDDEPARAPMIAPARSWIELEERRRVFWGGFCIDNYANISAGWPTLIDADLITTLLPASEDAFRNGTEETSLTLQDALEGGSGYSVFACDAIISHIFARLVRHSRRPMPGDRPEDPDGGLFWKRHRELDNVLANLFMFMPDRFRPSRNTNDPVAVQTNLTLHGAVICLHTAAREKADRFGLTTIGNASRARALTAAQEAVDIVKSSTRLPAKHKGPLVPLSLYFAASVYTAQAEASPTAFHRPNLELLIRFMDAIGPQNRLARAYLNQLLRDMERAGISVPPSVMPNHKRPHGSEHRCEGGYNIPLVARSSMPKRTALQPPLPGRLPPGAPQGTPLNRFFSPVAPCASLIGTYSSGINFDDDDNDDNNNNDNNNNNNNSDNDDDNKDADGDSVAGHTTKRQRTSARPSMPAEPSAWPLGSAGGDGERGGGGGGGGAGGPQAYVDPAPGLFEYAGLGTGWSYAIKHANAVVAAAPLPHRAAGFAAGGVGAQADMMPGYAGFAAVSGGIPRSPPPPPPPPPPPTYGPAMPGHGTTAAMDIDVMATTAPATAAAVAATTHPNGADASQDDMNGLFDNLREWGLGDPMTFYSMLLDVPGGGV